MRLKPFIRVCASCGAKQNKNEMIMLKKNGNEVVLGGQKSGGKSIYLCKECARKIDDNKTQGKAFKCRLSSENLQKLQSELKEN